MHKVEIMSQMPTTCLVCGRGNTPNDPDSLDDFWAIDLERDVNWGDSTYLCRYCVDELAALAGFVTEGQLEESADIAEGLRKELHETKAEFDSYRRRARAMLTGKKAERALRADSSDDDATAKKSSSKKRAAA